ncbi:pyocin knob domain-containing S74 family peptidase [Escherichia coli]|uniref:pyocin knob domain-containing S74 family peptidase n=1 Tax=Escherichia coli TaxID=562 RepID=UPI001F1377E9|nr:pyocin knob domain-containing S74 family peptidase [Escherichia coli]MCH6215750.1 pyocin knob domain-containing S74 family peptidase [Escherichia coli]MCH6485972.1 pyocin knob domain-containing S74 family peptidase [Escherichia coli]
MIYTTGTIAINGNTVTGTGTNFSAPLSLIRVGCTLIAIGNPVQIFTITEIKNGTELSVTPAANPAIAAGTKFSILLSDSISVDGLAQDVAETLRFYQEKEDEISRAIDGSNIGLGPEPRDCTDISGDPSSYVGFLRIKETTNGFPSVAAGESFLSGFICQRDASPSYTGVFVGWSTRSLYTYTWVAASGPNWTRHARKDEVDRLLQNGGSSKETQLRDGDYKNYLFVNNAGWGAYSPSGALKLGVMYGGTGAGNAAEARKNLMVMHDAKTSLSSTQNLNDLKGNAAGFYFQYLSANAKLELNYPMQVGGSLLVQKTGAGDAEGCIQTYYLFDDAKTTYRRVFNGEGWSAWKKIVATERIGEWGSETWVYNPDYSMRLGLNASLWGCYSDTQKKWIPLGVAQGGTGSGNAEDARTNLGIGPSNSPQFVNVALKRATDVTTGWVAGGIFHSTLAGTTGTERVYGAMYPETHLTEPDQLTMHLRSGGVNKYASLNINGEFIADYFKANKGYAINAGQDWDAQHTDNVDKFKPIVGSTNAPYNATFGGFHVGFSGNYATQFAGRNSSFYARSIESGTKGNWCQLATLNTANIWTADNHFSGHYVFDSSHTRFIRHIAYATTSANVQVMTWGGSSSPLNYEVKAVDTNGAQTSLKTLFVAKYLSDGSASLAVEGTVTCTSVTQSSDRDLKDNIQVIGDATEAIRKMNGYTYTLKENGLPYAGVIAQEVMEALPEAVGSFTHYGKELQGPTVDGNELREETRYLNVDYAAVTGLLVQVARETDNRVTELEEENASLRANIAVMDERITKLEALVRQLTGSEK